MKLYKVLTEDLRSCHGGSASWTPGEWMPKRDVKLCRSGYHLCRRGDLVIWLLNGPCSIWEAEARGEIVTADDKVCAPEARIVRRLPWGSIARSLFAADCAERVLPLYERRYPNDRRVRAAIEASRMYQVVAPERKAAASAAYAAASASAADASAAADDAYAASGYVYAAASAAASAARQQEHAWQTDRLFEYLYDGEEGGERGE